MSDEEMCLWNTTFDIIFESSSDDSASSSDSTSSSDDEEEVLVLKSTLVAREPVVSLARQKNYVERVIPTYSSNFFKDNFRYVLLFIIIIF